MDDAAVNIGQSIVASRVSEGKFFVVDSHLMQNRRMKVMHMHSIFDRMHSKIVCRAVCESSAYATARHEHREACVVVVAARFLLVF